MGWNEGYRIMEQQVVSLYDAGLLNKNVLNTLMQPFCDTDIDHGGSEDLKSKDGKSADDIICFIMEPEKYQEATENFIPDPKDPDWNEKLYDLYREITRREWNFW
ncbi:MAG: hypothetical protein ACM3TR_09700 [Caulobacteraceae bacterium]